MVCELVIVPPAVESAIVSESAASMISDPEPNFAKRKIALPTFAALTEGRLTV